MTMHAFTANLAGSKRAIEQLDAYFGQNVVGCGHMGSCRLSAERKGFCFNPTQLPHVGAAYDLSGDGRPWRIAVCGQEAGKPIPYRSIAERSPGMSAGGRTKPFTERNPHMQGTTNALRLLFGRPLSPDPKDENIIINGEYRHIYDAFALINALSCSSTVAAAGKNGKATTEMKRNCVEHLRATVQILRPTVLVVQGNIAGGMLRKAFPSMQVFGKTGGLIPGLGTAVALLSHPSARDDWRRGERGERTHLKWAALDSPYLHDVVAPILAGLFCRHIKREAGR
jgi:hypothetical protein